MAETTLAAGLYDASNTLVASWDTLVNTYGMDIEADQSGTLTASSPASVLCQDALSAGTKLVIADSVTKIGASAFSMNETLTCIIIPDSVTSIGEAAFVDCNNLVSINIPSGISTIGYNTFFDCWSMLSINIPDSVATIGVGAFRYCSKLTSVNIGNGVTSIEAGAFRGCDALVAVHYNGTEEGWQAVSIGDENTDLTDASIYYIAEEPEEQTPATATVSYEGETIESISSGEYVTLHTNGKKMEGDIRIEVEGTSGGGGTCSGEHVIPVDELPTENIDTNAVYSYDGAYYKYANEFVNVWIKADASMFLTDFCSQMGMSGVYFYTIPTKTTEGVFVSEAVWHCYYIEDENIVAVYGGAENGWLDIGDIWEFTCQGVITDTSEATEHGYYVVMQTGWTKYFAGKQVVEVAALPTENIDETVVYSYNGAYYKYVEEFEMYVDAGNGVITLREYYLNMGYNVAFVYHIIPTKTTDCIASDNGLFHYYYIEDEAKVCMYTAADGWTDIKCTVVSTVNEVTTQLTQYAVVNMGLQKYFVPSELLTITENGQYDVSQCKTAVVNTTAIYLVQTVADLPTDAKAGSMAIVLEGK